jgi:DNA-damage-inducible protein J
VGKAENLSVEPEFKKQAESVFKHLNIPFNVRPTSVFRLTKSQMDDELGKDFADLMKGNTKSAAKAFADIRRDYEI